MQCENFGCRAAFADCQQGTDFNSGASVFEMNTGISRFSRVICPRDYGIRLFFARAA
jgi:hypothetical protein